ncbi:hypothetical protein ZIOFF_018781 [Zingiber officinale]|uniref:Uncharacterized protein n=1 Tax=Zingiber officinale TaxID=94328 RepID=A0A8J5LIY1_ZINOF|nr:hypothetical protein ZIOFF_018781 [Zingiber officinale]
MPLLHGQADFHPNFLIFGTNSFCTFTFNLTIFLLVMKTIALTMNITGVIKDQLLMAFSWPIISDTITPINLFGYDVAFLGVAYYNKGPRGLFFCHIHPLISSFHPQCLCSCHTRGLHDAIPLPTRHIAKVDHFGDEKSAISRDGFVFSPSYKFIFQ